MKCTLPGMKAVELHIAGFDSRRTGSADFTMCAKLTAMAPKATHAVTCLRTDCYISQSVL
jgi:hypothetical protein